MTFPLRVIKEHKEGDEYATMRVETSVGRQSWLGSIQHTLSKTIEPLYRHKWTIMHPAEGMNWFTTDKPVIRLNYYSPDKYDFKGGWDRKGSEILFPLSPRHLLYTQIGNRPPRRGTRFSVKETSVIRRLIAENAFRHVFAIERDAEVSSLIPRTVNDSFFKNEEEQWRKWHSEQVASEQYFSSTRQI